MKETLLDPLTNIIPEIELDSKKRIILVFYNEFSLKRGPTLSDDRSQVYIENITRNVIPHSIIRKFIP